MDTMKVTALVIFLTGVCCWANPIDDLYDNINDDIHYQEEKNWIQDHLWVPIVGSIVFVILVIALCTCCCCGCCMCCRSKPSTVIVHSQQPGAQVSMASATNVVTSNPHHVGYNQ